jgi:CO/xanthine dehydrogenase FAD-binding subunit
LADAYGSSKVRGYLDAVTSGDVAAALTALDADVTVEDPLGAVQTGRAAAEAYLRGLVARGTKYELVLPVRGGGPQAAAAVRVRSGEGIHSVILLFTLTPNGSIASIKSYGGAE